ncbi:TPA: hypothetical protein ACJEU7_003365 [Acinetobacter baumannii]|uniref:hypothetical protein n=1 Tax=Acinetobacter baumannii TaxID=470 RepID=UPI00224E7998|nr:hypothetical protein [Acinetobacter baumannii]MCX3034181.1 hypothetical protein [Acinetobacter baumannii]
MRSNLIAVKLNKRVIEYQIDGDSKSITCPINTKIYPLFAVEYLMEQLKISQFQAAPTSNFSNWEVWVTRS